MSLVSWDLETHLVQPGLLAPPVVCGALATREKIDYANFGHSKLDFIPGPREDLSSVLMSRKFNHDFMLVNLQNDKLVWTGANIAYDFACLLAQDPTLFSLVWRAYEEARVFDVQIASSLNAIADGRMRDGELYRRDGSRIMSGRYSLDECVKEWLARSDAKENDRWRLSYALLEDVPLEEWPWDAKQYPVDDAVNTLEVAEAQLKGARNLHDMPTQAHAAFCIHLGAVWGLRTDPKKVDEFKKNAESHMNELRLFAQEKGFMRAKTKIRPDELSKNKKAIAEAVFKAYDGQPPSTPTGGISTSREALEDSGDETLVKLAELGKWEKFMTYVPTLEEAARAPLNVRSNPLLSTGRVSQDGLLLLIPRKGGVRECFVPRDGNAIVSCDYAAGELSTLAQVCIWSVGYSDLADAINSGKDAHCLLGAQLTNSGYEDFYKRYKEGGAFEKSIRQAAKAGNFGFPGMMGAAKFVIAQRRTGASVCEWFFQDGKCKEQERKFEWKDNPLDMPLCKRCLEQAEVIRSGYLTQWKEIRPYWRWVMQEVEANDAITQFVSGIVRGSPHGPAAANNQFQGLLAYAAKKAVIQITKEMYLKSEKSPLYGSRMLNFLHDETLAETPLDVLHESAHRQAQVMTDAAKLVVPDVVLRVEPAAMLNWSKSAEAVYVDGRLVPWTEKAKQ